MVARRIALVKPASVADEKVTHAIQLFDSILWAFQGSSRTSWTLVTPDAADVIVAHEADPDQRISGWRADGKIIVEFAVAEPSSATLVYPFRAAQVLALLERLDTQLKVQGEAPAPPAQSTPDPWAFVETLRTIREVENSEAWLVARNGRVPSLWLRADAGMYAAEHTTVQAIRRGTLNLSSLNVQRSPFPEGGPTPRAGAELSWFAAYHASAALAPWLTSGTRYRLNRWPNFGLIRPLPSHIRVAAALASTPARPDEIAARAKVSPEEAIRTLNALAAANVVATVDAAVAPARKEAPPAIQSPGSFSLFLRNVRKHLGLGT